MDDRSMGFVLVMMMSIVWAIVIVLSKMVLNNGVPAYTYIFQLISLSAIFVISYMFFFRRDKLRLPKRAHYPYIVLIAVFGTAMANLVGYYGLEHSSSINYGFLVKTAVVFTVILAHFMIGEHLSFHKALLVLVLLFGVYLITTEGRALVPSKYDIFIVISAFCYALTNNISKIVIRDFDTELLAMYRVVLGVVFIFIVVALFQEDFYVVRFPLLVLVASFHMAALTILTYRTLSVTSVSYLSMMSMATPIIVTVLGVLFLDEKLTMVQALGGFLIIVSGVAIHKKNI